MWINLYVDADTLIDGFQHTSWAPVFVPTTGVSVEINDVVRVNAYSVLSDNGINPNYFFEITIQRGDETILNQTINSETIPT